MPAPDFHNYARRLATAVRKVDTTASEARREAMNARIGRVFMHGLEIGIEHPKGSIRRGKGKDGRTWARAMRSHYGRVCRSKGEDGDPVDIFLGDHPESQLVFVIDQLDEDGNFDEHKVVAGVRNLAEAKKAYLDNYPDDWADTRLGPIQGYTMTQFKGWLRRGGYVKNKPTKAVTTKTAADAWWVRLPTPRNFGAA